MQVTYSNSSTGLCNITVNCSGWMFSVCDGGQCPLYQDSLSVSEVNITVSSGNGFIQCIVNNHVSAETKSQRMEDICIGEKKGIAAASLVGIIVGIVTGGLFLVGVGCIISTRRWRSPKEILLLKPVVPEVDNPVSTIPGRPEPQNTPGSEVTSIYVTAGRPEPQNTPGSEVTSIYVTAGRPEPQNTPGSEVTSIYVTAGRPEPQNTPGSEVTSIYVTAGRPEPQNTPGSEVTSIYVTAGRPGAVPAAAGGEEGHPGDTEHTSPEERKEPQSPPQAETFYSTLQIPAAAQRHPVGKGNNLKKPDTVYCTIGDFPSILLRDPLMLL
ncbi:mucin-1-like [Salvelinus alpinus]|uniref:mucin-1-like n=1 Tax=Salvelinus alpinus TaxID=8036 RepID=UPI0039FBC971